MWGGDTIASACSPIAPTTISGTARRTGRPRTAQAASANATQHARSQAISRTPPSTGSPAVTEPATHAASAARPTTAMTPRRVTLMGTRTTVPCAGERGQWPAAAFSEP